MNTTKDPLCLIVSESVDTGASMALGRCMAFIFKGVIENPAGEVELTPDQVAARVPGAHLILIIQERIPSLNRSLELGPKGVAAVLAAREAQVPFLILMPVVNYENLCRPAMDTIAAMPEDRQVRAVDNIGFTLHDSEANAQLTPDGTLVRVPLRRLTVSLDHVMRAINAV